LFSFPCLSLIAKSGAALPSASSIGFSCIVNKLQKQE
jgi:hypothetical protein